MMIDSHCHLDMLQQYDSIDNILKRALENDVKYVQTICTKISALPNILSIAEAYPNIFASVGVHPSEVKEIISAEELSRLASHNKIIGLGETGLDYFYNKDISQQCMQRESFQQHILVSQATNLPVIIHTRDAEDDTISIIESGMISKQFPALIHCFTSTKSFAHKMLDLGLYISFSGIVTFKNAEDLRNIIRFVPMDRILLETDSPYLAPSPMRGKTNEPAFTKYIAEVIANEKQSTVSQVADNTSDNFFRLFSKASSALNS